ncbi:MAG: class I SAM-dependent methyltransferase [Acidimicrobiales bacterium]
MDGPAGHPAPQFSQAWLRWRERVDLDEYDRRWDQLEAEGRTVHGEAEFVDSLGGGHVLDAGCGTGRVAVELSRRGHRVVGVDNDAEMLAYARRKPEQVRWEVADLSSLDLPERFDIILMAGNILPFVEPKLRSGVVSSLARHLRPGGLMVVGSSGAPGCEFATVDRWCIESSLRPVQRFATWDRQPYRGGDYRVSVDQLLR